MSLVRQATPEIRRLNLEHRIEQEPKGRAECDSELSKHYARACGEVTLLKKKHSGGELFLHLLWWSLKSSRTLVSFLNFQSTSSSYLYISLIRAHLPAFLSISAWAFTFLYFQDIWMTDEVTCIFPGICHIASYACCFKMRQCRCLSHLLMWRICRAVIFLSELLGCFCFFHGCFWCSDQKFCIVYSFWKYANDFCNITALTVFRVFSCSSLIAR